MLLVTRVAPVFSANCYIVAPAPGGECVIVDVGGGVADDVRATVAEHGLRPVAVLATHGHLDHVWGAAEICREYAAPLYVHAQDAYRVAEPFDSLGGSLVAGALAQLGLSTADYVAPERLETIETGHRGTVSLELAGLSFTWQHAPGHTEGSSLLALPGAPSSSSVLLAASDLGLASAPSTTVLSGDVLFAGSIGRTDLPGGDDAEMAVTLRSPVGTLAPDALVLPGHGPATRMAHELRHNPFLTAQRR